MDSQDPAQHESVYRPGWKLIVARLSFVVALVAIVGWRLSVSYQGTTLPTAQLQAMNQGWANEKTCVVCHSQAETFWETGHAKTLSRITEGESALRLEELNRFLRKAEIPTQLEELAVNYVAIHQEDGFESRLRLDWCFGSGEHARTWVGTLRDSHGATDLVEFRWSWYHDLNDFAITPGQPETVGGGYFGNLGLLFDPPKAQRCFGCHTSYLPVTEGRIETHAMKTGVTCQRCHGPREQHVASEGEVIDHSWRNADQMESVNRCAECHRRAEEQKPAEITHHNTNIARFQPVGLIQSPCFKGSQMTCLTCHDPHQTLTAQDSLGIWQCTQCHDGTEKNHSFCSAGHQDRCIECHMPKIEMESPMKFTDHWIRIRDDIEATE